MTKQQVRVELGINWIDALEGLSRVEAIEWIRNNVPDFYVLEYGYNGYNDSSSGIMVSSREETDQEYESRKAKELARDVEREYLKRMREEATSERMERLKREEASVYAYLSKHKGNPHIGDLENLFRTLVSVEAQGKSGGSLKECMARLERDTP